MIKWIIASIVVAIIAYGGWYYHTNPSGDQVIEEILKETGTE